MMANRGKRPQLKTKPKSTPARGSQGAASPNPQTLPFNAQSKSMTQTASQQQLLQWPQTNPTGNPYPDMPKINDTTPLLESMGASGTAIFSGIITSEEYNPDFYWKDGIRIYEQMLRNDGQINAMRMMVELPIRRATWTVEPFSDSAKDKEIASFVESCLFHDMSYTTTEGRVLTQKWDDILRHILMMLWYGFMCFEVNWKIEDGWTKWARWTPLLPRTIWRWWVGTDNELVGVQQWTFKNYSYEFVDIPAEKLLVFVHRQEGNNFEGVSLLRSAYKHWFYKVQFEKIEAIGIERNAIVPPIVHLPENFTGNDIQIAQMIGQNMRSNELGAVTLPPGMDVEYPKNMQRYAMQVQPSIQYHDVMIARNVLAQFLNLGSSETGSYALADTQVQTFLNSMQAVAEQVEDVINSDAVKRLVDYNYDDVEGYPKVKCSKLQGDLNVIGNVLKDMASMANPLITPDPETEDWIRDLLGMPKASHSTVQATNPTAPANAARPDSDPGHTEAQPQDKPGVPSDSAPLTASEDLAQQVTLLNESLRALDAVGRGQEHIMLSNDYPRQKGGRFGFGNGAGYKGGSGAGSHKAEAGHMMKRSSDAKGDALKARVASARAAHEKASARYASAKTDTQKDSAFVARAKTSDALHRAEAAHAAHAAKSGGASSASHGKGEEGMHEKSARLQREQGLERETQPGEKITPVKIAERGKGIDINRPQYDERNIQAMRETYGDHQLGAYYHSLSQSGLRDFAKGYNETHTDQIDTKGAMNNHDELASRITAKVTEGRYSANFGKGAKAGASSAKASTRGKSTDARLSKLEAQHQELMAAHKALMAQSKAQAKELARVKAENARLKAKGEAKAKSRAKSEMPQPSENRAMHTIPGFKPDPYVANLRALHMIHGTDGLRGTLHDMTVTTLKGMAHQWVTAHPQDGKPASMSRRADLESYLHRVAVAHDGEIHSQKDVNDANAREPVTNGGGA